MVEFLIWKEDSGGEKVINDYILKYQRRWEGQKMWEKSAKS